MITAATYNVPFQTRNICRLSFVCFNLFPAGIVRWLVKLSSVYTVRSSSICLKPELNIFEIVTNYNYYKVFDISYLAILFVMGSYQ